MSDSAQRVIPAVETVIRHLGDTGLPRPLVVDAIRRELSAIRAGAVLPIREEILRHLKSTVSALQSSRLQPVINATGIPLHTNFGRAPIGSASLKAIYDIGSGYSNLEYNLEAGSRGQRGAYVEKCLALLCEAESATVVNNCAAALMLILRHLTLTKKEVIISRGELIQIGGGFRIPEILEASGAALREVGTTNHTSLEDYARAVGSETALLLKVHRSNFYIGGFTGSVSTAELAGLARSHGIPLVEDLGSGAVEDTRNLGCLEQEPSPAEVLKAGVDLVCFSGDKLFGGPQAGIIVGKAALVAALKRDPLFRALRCDKLILAALQASSEAHLSGTARHEIPAVATLAIDRTALRQRAENMAEAVQELPVIAAVAEVEAEIGGGTLPRSLLPSIALSLTPQARAVDSFASALRQAHPPVVGYIAKGRLLLDLRTVASHQDALVLEAIRQALPHP